MRNQAIFKMFDSCRIVCGARRAAIYDLQRGNFETIPLTMAEVLNKYEGKSLKIIHEFCKSIEEIDIVNAYFDYLVKKEYGFWCENSCEFSMFPSSSNEWDMPYKITNAVLDYDAFKNYDIRRVLSMLINIKVPYIQIRFFSRITLDYLFSLINIFSGSIVKSIDISLPYDKGFEKKMELIEQYCKEYLRINQIIFFGANFYKKIELCGGLTQLLFATEILDSEVCCGNVSTELFRINQLMFLESQSYNSCLNRKLGIDRKGFLKNCPSMAKSFGYVHNVDIDMIVDSFEFKEKWYVSKDDIEICKDCEFRYMCMDCRAYVDGNGFKAKPKKCRYNPYLCLWENG
jgi:SPASM domain peptide maturase of grasp-with-spasm system